MQPNQANSDPTASRSLERLSHGTNEPDGTQEILKGELIAAQVRVDDLPTEILDPDLQKAHIESTDFIVDNSKASLALLAPIAARYLIRDEIARGGVGVIYSATDKTLSREVAVKVLQTAHQAKPEVYRRFSAEAQICCAMHHPGIVPIYDYGILSDGRPFIVMDRVHGQTLSRMLAARQHPDDNLPKFLRIFESVCQTVAYAHSKGIIHRDLKPQNIMVSPFGAVHVIDWGIAKVISGPSTTDEANKKADGESPDALQSDTIDGSVLGTVTYMAPEQATGHIDSVDKRADVFGLGGILCEILTGFPPYGGVDIPDAYLKAKIADLEAAYARLSSCGAEQTLIRLAKRCMQANPDDRFADAGQLAGVLNNYLEDLIHRAEHDLVRFFELSMDLFCIAGFDGVLHRINSNFSKVLGYPDSEFLTRPFLDFVHPDDLQLTVNEMEKLIRGLPVIQFRNRYRDIHGEYRWFEWTAKSIVEEQTIFAVARDVTDRLKAEQKPLGN